MGGHFALAYLLSFIFVANASGQVCGTQQNEPCSATQIFDNFTITYLLESTSETNKGACTYLVRQSHGIVDGKANLSLVTIPEDGSNITLVTAEVTLTDDPAAITVVFSNDPDTSYDVGLPYANYSACFVADFNATLGCRLWVYQGTAVDTVEACREGHVQVCGEAVYNTYNETVCFGGQTEAS